MRKEVKINNLNEKEKRDFTFLERLIGMKDIVIIELKSSNRNKLLI
jgi:hypothetical protein